MHKFNTVTLIDQIDALLPQTQCTQCGYAGCRPYAEAMAAGEAGINQCPPGGTPGIRQLATLLGVEFQPFADEVIFKPLSVACIDETQCIGCTLCLQACPVDAIAGAAKQMHTVIADECTGCELCVAPCPVDCISMKPLAILYTDQAHRAVARERYQFHVLRLARDKREKAEKMARPPVAAADTQALIRAAMERAKAQAAVAAPKNIDNLSIEQQAQIAKIDARRANDPAKTEKPEE